MNKKDEKDLVPIVEFPEGGYGYVQICLSFTIHFISVGQITSFGVFQQYYKTLPFFQNVSTIEVSLIGASAASGLTLFGILAGELADKIGYAKVSAAGSLIMFAGLFIASYSTSYLQLLMAQGVLFGLGSALSYNPAISILSRWFQKRRGFAAGLAASGTGVGGLLLGPLIRAMLVSYDWQSSLRYLAIGGCSITFICACFLRERIGPTKKSDHVMAHFFADPKFIWMAVASVFNSFGYFIPFFFITVYSVSNGLSGADGALVLGLMNGASAVGRFGLGLAADWFGCMNMLVACLLLSVFSIFGIWTVAHDMASITIFSIMYGIGVGGYISVIPSATASLFGKENISTKTASVMFGNSFGSLFGPILGAFMIQEFTRPDNTIDFIPAIMVCGGSFVIGTVLQIIVRMSASKGVWNIKV
ncbi:hypothetical protein HK103_007503 [Boothiomyces macroporosus]|uniref:Major facilitator superfamily (MFS) profile domain-containing protein n=1 Tax=Boothiomyces macroporosus TaxID=261099 RepID=A0AAD5Y1R9_9FUNG|nr:hypothetical protein HK103_007503 [Boothiomyces macroporosus]